MGASTAAEETASHRQLPTPEALEEASEIKIKDKDGNEVAFKSLFIGKPESERQLIVFIRHFFCGSCEMFVIALGKDLPPSALSAVNTNVTIIGCGEPVCIPDYIKRTNCPYPVYAEPSVQIYKKLGMMSTLKYNPINPRYYTKSFFKNAVDSTWNALMSGHALSAGPAAQNGGEFLFQNGEVKWCSRMRNTGDHTETEELKQVLGIDE